MHRMVVKRIALLCSALAVLVENLEWREPLQVVKYPDPQLRAPNARIAKFDEKLKELARQMFQIMYQ